MNKSSAAFLLLFFSIPLIAQDFEDYVASYTGTNGKGYMQPFADAFSANVNSGFYHSAEIQKRGFNVYFGIVAMTAFISDDSRTFKASTGEFFLPKGTFEAPTIFGKTKPVTVDGNSETQFTFPGGLNINKLPIAVPQLTIGSFSGTDLTLRFMQINLDDNFGNINVFGVGARHNIDQYLKKLPIKVAAGIYYQTFDIGKLIEASSFFVSTQASYSVSQFILYGGLGYESSTMNISYNSGTDDEPNNINFDVDATNSIRLTLGAGVKLGFFNLHTDYNLGSQNVWVVGFGFDF